jgi:hypothetical protein
MPVAARPRRRERDESDHRGRLREAADLLEQQAANPFRVRAYREAAQTVSGLGQDRAIPSCPGSARAAPRGFAPRFTALFSNTARAHELGKTRDWVVVYFHTDTQSEGQRTTVTETSGRLAGRRVVRGRESECLAAYGMPESSQGTPSASNVSRKKAPKSPPRAQNAGRLT